MKRRIVGHSWAYAMTAEAEKVFLACAEHPNFTPGGRLILDEADFATLRDGMLAVPIVVTESQSEIASPLVGLPRAG